MNHRTTPDFWDGYNALPREVRQLADKNYELLKNDPSHPSLELKMLARCGRCASVCITGR